MNTRESAKSATLRHLLPGEAWYKKIFAEETAAFLMNTPHMVETTYARRTAEMGNRRANELAESLFFG